MRPETKEFIIYEFGRGVHASHGLTSDDRYTAGYDGLAETMRDRIEEVLRNETIGSVNRDILGAILAEVTAHDWKMAAIHLFNAKETA